MTGTRFRVARQHPSRTLDAARCRRALEHVARREGVALSDLTLVLCDHARVRALNRTYLGHDYDTDVLAFDFRDPSADEPEPERSAIPEDDDQADADSNAAGIEGEIYVDLDTAAERFGEFGATYEEEALRYAIHGLLHLIGYTDKTEDDKHHMHALEDGYLEELRIGD